MIRQTTDKGSIVIDSNVYTNIAGAAASSCFGDVGID
ncbi:MAG: Asp23/Gls24 family envelope stress response protein, partial [Ruminococcaceae bacterium]|nr:Asp23/Gls24 family envelope stress response protein [Oscillospiraceae bacterium]